MALKPADLPIMPDDKPMLSVLRGQRHDPVPVWMMRQAGRYLPEYRERRGDKGGFLDLVYDSRSPASPDSMPRSSSRTF